MTDTLILRFRDLGRDPGSTIDEHNAIIAKENATWWGWWHKFGEAVPTETFKVLADRLDQGELDAFLFDTGAMRLYNIKIAKIHWDHRGRPCATPDGTLTPHYYNITQCLGWFQITSIADNPHQESELSNWSYTGSAEFFAGANTNYTPFENKAISSFQELRHQERTIWPIRKRQAADPNNEIILYHAAPPTDFPKAPIDSRAATLLWVSDPHFCDNHHNFPLASDHNGKNLASAIHADWNAIGSPPLAGLIISGDLTWKASSEEFEHAHNFIRDVQSWAGIREEERIVTCPGNHDIRYSDTPWDKAAPIGYPEETAIEEYAKFYQGIFRIRPNNHLASGRRFLLGGSLAVDIAALNSCKLAQIKDQFQGQGFLSDDQLSYCAESMGWSRPKENGLRALRIAFLHHHVLPVIERETPWASKAASTAYDAGALLTWALAHDVDIILHGHMHRAFCQKVSRRVDGAWKEVVIASAGSAGAKLDHTTDKTNSYALISVSKDGVTIRIREISSEINAADKSDDSEEIFIRIPS